MNSSKRGGIYGFRLQSLDIVSGVFSSHLLPGEGGGVACSIPPSLLHSFTPSLPPSLTPSHPCSLTLSPPHSLPPSLPHTLAPSLSHPLTPSLPHSLTPSHPCSLTLSLPRGGGGGGHVTKLSVSYDCTYCTRNSM